MASPDCNSGSFGTSVVRFHLQAPSPVSSMGERLVYTQITAVRFCHGVRDLGTRLRDLHMGSLPVFEWRGVKVTQGDSVPCMQVRILSSRCGYSLVVKLCVVVAATRVRFSVLTLPMCANGKAASFKNW